MRSHYVFSRSSDARRAYTLLEVVLTLAIIMAIAAMSWPKLMTWIEDRKLSESAQAVQTALNKARMWSIDTSLTYQFRFEPDGRYFVVVPYDRAIAVADQSGEATVDPSLARRMLSGELPEGIEFRATVVTPQVEQLSAELLAGLPDAAKLSQVRWSSPTFFYSDGTATDAVLLLEDEKERQYRVSVRGLTGIASAQEGGIEDEDQL